MELILGLFIVACLLSVIGLMLMCYGFEDEDHVKFIFGLILVVIYYIIVCITVITLVMKTLS